MPPFDLTNTALVIVLLMAFVLGLVAYLILAERKVAAWVQDRLGLEVLSLTFLVVNAYAAAIVGRLVSLPLTYLGALILGLIENYAVGYLPKNPEWLTEAGWDFATTLRLAIPVVMLFQAAVVWIWSPENAGKDLDGIHV